MLLHRLGEISDGCMQTPGIRSAEHRVGSNTGTAELGRCKVQVRAGIEASFGMSWKAGLG